MSDPRPFTMRHLWWMACGSLDEGVMLQLFLTAILAGRPIEPDDFTRNHPLRSIENPPEEREPSEVVVGLAMDRMAEALAEHNREHHRG